MVSGILKVWILHLTSIHIFPVLILEIHDSRLHKSEFSTIAKIVQIIVSYDTLQLHFWEMPLKSAKSILLYSGP